MYVADVILCAVLVHVSSASRDADDDEEFRTFRKQLYHAQIVKILEPLRPHMTEPVLMRCPDGYYRRVIFELGPFIADYPEQVYLAGIVQGWCPKCESSCARACSLSHRMFF
jgi:hypothetical protein